MAVSTVLVCETQVPLVRGGAELLVQQLVDELRARGVETDRVSVPFKWYPKDEILPHAAAWRLLDLEREQRPADRSGDRHEVPHLLRAAPAKVCWLVHQHRAAYELCGTQYSDFGNEELDVALRDRLMALDEQMLAECRGLYTISQTVSARLQHVQRPRLDAALSSAADGDAAGARRRTATTCCRWRGSRRTSASIWRCARWRTCPSHLRLRRRRRRQLPRSSSSRPPKKAASRDRVTFRRRGQRRCAGRAVSRRAGLVYVPFDEDYGLATLEAFLAQKPVITARDSGGTLEFVERRRQRLRGRARSGQAIAGADRAARRRSRARGIARRAGRDLARTITWDTRHRSARRAMADPARHVGRDSGVRRRARDRAASSIGAASHARALARESSSSTTARRTTPARPRRTPARTVIRHPYNKGNGASVKTGIRHATGDCDPRSSTATASTARRRHAARQPRSATTISSSARARRQSQATDRAPLRQRRPERARQLSRRAPDSRSDVGLPRRAARLPARVPPPAAERLLDADDDDAGVSASGLQRALRADRGAAAVGTVEDPARA